MNFGKDRNLACMTESVSEKWEFHLLLTEDSINQSNNMSGDQTHADTHAQPTKPQDSSPPSVSDSHSHDYAPYPKLDPNEIVPPPLPPQSQPINTPPATKARPTGDAATTMPAESNPYISLAPVPTPTSTKTKLAFCSDKPLSYQTGDQTQWSYYKVVVIPLHQLRAVNSSTANPSENFIQIISVDNHEFWFMGFVHRDSAVKYIQEA